jgi:MarR family transcriptional regulator, transcriptional regulator for hemolysin
MPKRPKSESTQSARDAIQALTDPAYREHSDLLYLMHELSRLISIRADKDLSKVGLTHAQWWALMHIYEHEGATQSELAEILQMGRAGTGTLLERLEAKKWIERRADEADNRVRRVFLRHEVVPIFRHMTDEGRALFRSLLAGLSPTEEARLLAGIRKIKANAEK